MGKKINFSQLKVNEQFVYFGQVFIKLSKKNNTANSYIGYLDKKVCFPPKKLVIKIS